MAQQQTIWTALPNGATGEGAQRKLKLSVHVSVRLDPDADQRLAPFDFVNWPAHVQPSNLRIDLVFDGGPTVRAAIVSAPPSLTKWQALFSADTFVRSRAVRQRASQPVSTHSVGALHSYLKTGYQRIAFEAMRTAPSRSQVAAVFREIHGAFATPVAGERPIPADLPLVERRTLLAERLFRGTPSALTESVQSLRQAARQEALQAAPQWRNRGVEFVAPPMIEVVPLTDATTPVTHFARVVEFHHQEPDQAPAPMPVRADFSERGGNRALDFHQMVAALGAHPALMRELGLVIDVEIPADGIRQGQDDSPQLLEVVPVFTAPLTCPGAALSPATAYLLDAADRFEAAPVTEGPGARESIYGFLNLGLFQADGPEFILQQLDVDGAALKTLRAAGSMPRDEPGDDSSPTVGLPSLRTQGMGIARTQQAHAVHRGFIREADNDATLTAGERTMLYAEDLVRGYRVDVFDAFTERWLSLHQRIGTYKFLNLGDQPPPVHDEGMIQIGATQPGGTPDDLTELHIHESLFDWDGWSLSAPRPGKTISRDPRAPTPDEPATQPVRVDNEAVAGLPLEVTFQVEPGTLPRLRFGSRYKMRVRTVDLAGNGHTLADAGKALARLAANGNRLPVLPLSAPGRDDSEPLTYRRFEPVAAPALVPRNTFGYGQAIDTLVIHSDVGVRSEAFAIQDPLLRSSDERHLAPPKTAQIMAERYGQLDASFGTGGNFRKTYDISRRERGSFNDTSILNVQTGADEPVDDIEIVPINANDSNRGYAIHRAAQLRIPYLPDPCARGVTLRNLPGTAPSSQGQVNPAGQLAYADTTLLSDASPEAGSLTQIDFGDSSLWPDLRPFRLQLVEGNTAPTWDDANRVLRIALEQGTEATVRVSASVAPGDVDIHGLWPWIEEQAAVEVDAADAAAAALADRAQAAFAAAALDAVDSPPGSTVPLATLAEAQALASEAQAAGQGAAEKRRALPDRLAHMHEQAEAGLHWMLTPYRDITLRHAVLRPMAEPSFQMFEPVPPNLFTASQRERTYASFIGEIKLHGGSTAKLDVFGAWDDPYDDVDEDGPGVRAFKAHAFEIPVAFPGRLPIEEAVDLSAWADRQPMELLRFALLIRPGLEDYPELRALSSWFVPKKGVVQLSHLRHEFGDTKHRHVRYRVVATTRFADCFPRSLTEDASRISRESEELRINILSTARPAAPKVLYALPTFEWQRPEGRTLSQVRKRLGGGVRVYLDRPWFSSGAGELLGVIVASDLRAPAHPLLRPYVTQWGQDPIWRSVSAAPEFAGDELPQRLCPLATRVGRHHLEEVGGAIGEVGVAGHEVQYDTDRRLWFADIQIDLGHSYTPFVRLALVRYQPDSIEHAELSRVVVTDFVQLAPGRTVMMVADPDDDDGVTLSLSGLTYQTGAAPDGSATKPAAVTVTVERHLQGAGEYVAWVAVTDPSVRIQTDQVPPGGTVLWTGHITLPSGRTPGEFRIAVKEFERFSRDGDQPGEVSGSRLVFVETIDV
jgi:hypothetical protein